jgi:hypothetical protein
LSSKSIPESFWLIAAGMAAFTVIQTIIMRHLSGWPELARWYRSADQQNGVTFRFQRGVVGKSVFRNHLTVLISPAGLTLSTYGMLFCPRLLIPWSKLTRFRNFSYWGQQFGECYVVTPERTVLLCLPPPIWTAAAQFLPAPTPPPLPGSIQEDSGGLGVMKRKMTFVFVTVGIFLAFMVWMFSNS